MTKTVFKYSLAVKSGPQQIQLPILASVLHAAMQGEELCIWALVDPEMAPETRSFVVYGTGHAITNADRLKHIDTVMDGPFVWHVFEVLS